MIATSLFVLTLLIMVFAVACGFGCARLSRRVGQEPSTGFTLGLVLGVGGFLVVGLRHWFDRREKHDRGSTDW